MSSTQAPPPPTGMDDAFGRALAAAQGELSGLVDAQTWSLEDTKLDQRLAEALAVRAAADQVIGQLVGEITDRDMPTRVGASSTRAHLIGKHRMSAGEASRVVKAAKVLHGRSAITDPVRRAQACGVVSGEQAVVIATAIHKLSPSIDLSRVEDVQAHLIDHAQTLGFDQLRQVANHAVEVVDPDGADQALEEQLAAQEKRAWETASFSGQCGADGIARGRFRLPNLAFSMLKKHLEALASPRRPTTAPDPSDNNSSSGSDEQTSTDAETPVEGEQRPYATRMGQALIELIDHLPLDEH